MSFFSAQESAAQSRLSDECRTPVVTMLTTDSGKQINIIDNATNAIIESSRVFDSQQRAVAIASLIHAKPRHSCIAILASGSELWEISYDKQREPVFHGYVHDYQMQEGLKDKRQYPPKMTQFDRHFSHFRFDQSFRFVLASDDENHIQLLNLDIRRKMIDLTLDADGTIDLTPMMKNSPSK